MATQFLGGPSNIIDFPIARRAILGGKLEAAKPQKPDGDAAIARAFTSAFGEAWYHEAALREVDPSRKQ